MESLESVDLSNNRITVRPEWVMTSKLELNLAHNSLKKVFCLFVCLFVCSRSLFVCLFLPNNNINNNNNKPNHHRLKAQPLIEESVAQQKSKKLFTFPMI